METAPREGRGFPTTHWSMVEDAAIAARAEAPHDRPQSLSLLLSRYMPVLHNHLVMHKRMGANDADDVLQGFVTSKVLEQDLLGRADRNRGRFRSYLLTVLGRYQIDWQRSQGIRRRRLEATQPDEASIADPSAGAADAFTVDWARALLNQATQRTREHFRDSQRDDLWVVFKMRVLDPLLEEVQPPSYEALRAQLGYETATQACSALQTAKRTFARVLRQVIAEYVGDPEQIDDEIADLHRILSEGHA